MSDCLFCKIANGEIPSNKVLENDDVLAFRDIAPMAPTHVLVIPKTHVSGVSTIDQVDDRLLGACLRACREVAILEGIDQRGYRVVSNCGEDACQSVHHLHFHVLGGTKLSEKMV